MVEQVRKLSFAAHALLDAGLSSNVAAGMLELAAGRVDDNAMKAHLMAVVSALRDGTFDRVRILWPSGTQSVAVIVRPGGAALRQLCPAWCVRHPDHEGPCMPTSKAVTP